MTLAEHKADNTKRRILVTHFEYAYEALRHHKFFRKLRGPGTQGRWDTRGGFVTDFWGDRRGGLRQDGPFQSMKRPDTWPWAGTIVGKWCWQHAKQSQAAAWTRTRQC